MSALPEQRARSARAWLRPRASAALRFRRSPWEACSACIFAPCRLRAMPRSCNATKWRSAASSTPCSSAACTWRRLHTRRASSQLSTLKRISKLRLRPQTPRSVRCCRRAGPCVPGVSPTRRSHQEKRRQAEEDKKPAAVGDCRDHDRGAERRIAPEAHHGERDQHSGGRGKSEVQRHRRGHYQTERHLLIEPISNQPERAAPDESVQKRNAQLFCEQLLRVLPLQLPERDG